MNVNVHVSAYYRWTPLAPGATAPEGAVTAQQEYLGETRTMVRELVNEPSTTEIVVPDESLDQMHADHVEAGGQMSRNQFLARHLEDAVMANHAPSAHWQGADSDDPEVHDHLQNWVSQFPTAETKGLPAGTPATDEGGAPTAAAPSTDTQTIAPADVAAVPPAVADGSTANAGAPA